MFSIDKALKLKSELADIIGTPIDAGSDILIDEIIILNPQGQEVIEEFIDEEELEDLRQDGSGYQIILSGEFLGEEITQKWVDYCKSFQIDIGESSL